MENNEKNMNNIEENEVDISEDVNPETAFDENTDSGKTANGQTKESDGEGTTRAEAAAPTVRKRSARNVIEDNADHYISADTLDSKRSETIAFLKRAKNGKELIERPISGIEPITLDDGSKSYRVLFNIGGIKVYIPREDFANEYSFLSDVSSSNIKNPIDAEFAVARRMLDANISFIITDVFVDKDENDNVIVTASASRTKAMEAKREKYFFAPKTPVVKKGTKIKVRVIATSYKYLKVEALGVEVDIKASELSSCAWINPELEYSPSDVIYAVVTDINVDKENRTIDMSLSCRPCDANTVTTNLNAVTVGGYYSGEVVAMNESFIYINLKDMRIRAIVPIKYITGRVPWYGEKVRFRVARIDYNRAFVYGYCESRNQRAF